jgi:fatty acid desaturase
MWAFPGSVLVNILNAVFFGVLLVQAGMLGHDLSHKQVFHSEAWGRRCALIAWSFVCGLSERGWYDKHNAHHKHVNHLDEDPDLEIPFVFAGAQHETKSWWVRRFIVPYQQWLFFILLPLVYPNFVLWTFKNIFTSRDLRSLIEGVLVVAHFALFFGVPYVLLGLWGMVIFCITSGVVGGVYMSMVFAPNHKGEEVIVGGETTWEDQIRLTRNLRHHRVMFHIFGGLDLQIEHHLFPSMSRFNYPKVQPIVKQFCKEQGIEYYETSWWGSMKEIYASLKYESGRHAG